MPSTYCVGEFSQARTSRCDISARFRDSSIQDAFIALSPFCPSIANLRLPLSCGHLAGRRFACRASMRRGQTRIQLFSQARSADSLTLLVQRVRTVASR
jgi:hypothetical protein